MSYADKIRHALSAYEPRELGERLGAVGAEADARLEVAQRMADALSALERAHSDLLSSDYTTRGNPNPVENCREVRSARAALAEWENTK